MDIKHLMDLPNYDMLAHAFLFYGSKGSGKRKAVEDFSKKLINGDLNLNPDFILIEPSKGISISQIRDLIKNLSLKPYNSRYKIGVVLEAHQMTVEAQNCFLKTLEEPTSFTILILVTQYPNKLLNTITSRVQKVRFPSSDIKLDSQITEDLLKLTESDLAYRFNWAKKIIDSEVDLLNILDSWTAFLRELMLKKISDIEVDFSLNKLKDNIREIESTRELLSSSNANKRLALEVLLMKL